MSTIIRLPIHETGDRKDVLQTYGVSGQRYIEDEQGSAYLAVVDDISKYPDCQLYEPHVDFGDNSCVHVETLSSIERTGYWKRRATGRFTVEVKNTFPDSEARERLMRLENIISVNPCMEKKTQRGTFEYPLPIQQTYTITQLQQWAENNGLTGNGLTVVLVDTGITFRHVQFGFQNKVPFSAIVGQSFSAETSPNNRIQAILVKKVWIGDWDLPDEYVLRCGIQDLGGHGSHCAGILAGERGAVGLAGKSKIIMINNSILNSAPNQTCSTTNGLSGISYWDLTDLVQAGYSPTVISNSWGASITIPTFYSGENSDYDTFLYENPSILMLFAAGNEGQDAFSLQALSRNILAIGSTTDHKKLSSFSSAGPTVDRKGHFTVHVLTNGQGVLSANAFSDTSCVVKSGTSMATPLAAGIATLLREWLIKKGHKNSLSGSLLRTLLIHCAVPLASVDPTAQGFGFLQPALITDYGNFLEMGDHLLNSTANSVTVYHRIATKSELFRMSIGWYTTPGYFLENVAGISCLRNTDYFNKTDGKNTLTQMTLHLEKGDEIVCNVTFFRSHDNAIGFNVSVVVGVWPTYVLYVPEDTDVMKVGDAVMSFVRRGFVSSEPLLTGTSLLTSAWPCRSVFREIMQTPPVLFLAVAIVIIGTSFASYYALHVPDEILFRDAKNK